MDLLILLKNRPIKINCQPKMTESMDAKMTAKITQIRVQMASPQNVLIFKKDLDWFRKPVGDRVSALLVRLG